MIPKTVQLTEVKRYLFGMKSLGCEKDYKEALATFAKRFFVNE